jgi:hypothetical protein
MSFFNDLFSTSSTVNLVGGHTSDSGATWVQARGTVSPQVFTASGGIVANGGNSPTAQIVRPSVIAPGADVSVSAAFHYDSANFDFVGLTARMSADGTTGYLAAISKSAGKWAAWKLTASGNATDVAQIAIASTTTSYSQGNEPNVQFDVIGSQLKLTVNGAVLIDYTDPSPITAAGYTGLYFFVAAGAGSGMWITSMSATVPGAITNPNLTGLTVTAYDSVSVTATVTTDDAAGTLYWLYDANPTDTATVVETGQSRAVTAAGAQAVNGSGLTPSTLYYLHVVQTDPSGGVSSVVTTSFTTAAPAAPTITGVTISPSPASVPGGSTQSFTATVAGTNGPSQAVTWSGTGAARLSSTTANPATFTAPPATGSDQTFSLTATASDGAHTATVTITVPASSAAPIPTPVQLRTRVRESVSNVSVGGVVTLSGAVAGPWRSFSSVWASGRDYIYAFVGEVSGSAWMEGYFTLVNATSLAVISVEDGSAGAGVVPTFGAGAKEAYVMVSDQLIVKPNFIDGASRKYVVDLTGTNDSTAGVQAAMDEALNRGIQEVRYPVGNFKLAGPRAGSGNCQVAIRDTREAHPNRSLRIVGAGAPDFEQQGLRSVEPPTNGTLFFSTLTAADVPAANNPAVFGFEQPNAGDAWPWNYTNVSFEKLGIRTTVAQQGSGGAANPLSALNFQFAAQVPWLDQLRIDVSRGIPDMVKPTTGSCGIIMPPVDNHLLLNVGMVYISGYNNAVILQEHTHIDNLISIGNVNGVVLKGAKHASNIGIYSAEWTDNAFVMDGDHALTVTLYDPERNSGFNADLLYKQGSLPLLIVRGHGVVSGGGLAPNFVAVDTSGNAVTGKHKILFGVGVN